MSIDVRWWPTWPWGVVTAIRTGLLPRVRPATLERNAAGSWPHLGRSWIDGVTVDTLAAAAGSAPVRPGVDRPRAGRPSAGQRTDRAPGRDAPSRPRVRPALSSRTGGAYQLRPSMKIPPLLLSPDEVSTIITSLLVLEAWTPDDTSAAAARAKLEQVLPPSLRQRAAATALSTQILIKTPAPVDWELIGKLADAVATGAHLHFTYTDQNGRESRRTVEPYRHILRLAALVPHRLRPRSQRLAPVPTRPGRGAYNNPRPAPASRVPVQPNRALAHEQLRREQRPRAVQLASAA